MAFLLREGDKTETDGMHCSMSLFNFSFDLQLQLAFLQNGIFT